MSSGSVNSPKRAKLSDKPFANTAPFYAALGWFYAVWSSVELTIDCAICKFENTPPEQAHRTLAALKFSDRTKRLRALLAVSGRSNIAEVAQLLESIEGDFRNVFSHSFLASSPETVTFVHRKATKRNGYECLGYQLTTAQFFAHVQDFVQRAHAFEQALGLSHEEIAEFASYALPKKTDGI
jgi:hypothetical protein